MGSFLKITAAVAALLVWLWALGFFAGKGSLEKLLMIWGAVGIGFLAYRADAGWPAEKRWMG